jgi:hypothetical protein
MSPKTLITEQRDSQLSEALDLSTASFPQSLNSTSQDKLPFQNETKILLDSGIKFSEISDEVLSRGLKGGFLLLEFDQLGNDNLDRLEIAEKELAKRITGYCEKIPEKADSTWAESHNVGDEMLARLRTGLQESYNMTGKSSVYQQLQYVVNELETRKTAPEGLLISKNLWEFAKSGSEIQEGAMIPKEINREHVSSAQMGLSVLIDATRHQPTSVGELKVEILRDSRVQGASLKPTQGFQLHGRQDAYHFKVGPRDRLCFMINDIEGVPSVHNIAIFDSHKSRVLEAWYDRGRRSIHKGK